jgi:hypothetical protein
MHIFCGLIVAFTFQLLSRLEEKLFFIQIKIVLSFEAIEIGDNLFQYPLPAAYHHRGVAFAFNQTFNSGFSGGSVCFLTVLFLRSARMRACLQIRHTSLVFRPMKITRHLGQIFCESSVDITAPIAETSKP